MVFSFPLFEVFDVIFLQLFGLLQDTLEAELSGSFSAFFKSFSQRYLTINVNEIFDDFTGLVEVLVHLLLSQSLVEYQHVIVLVGFIFVSRHEAEKGWIDLLLTRHNLDLIHKNLLQIAFRMYIILVQ